MHTELNTTNTVKNCTVPWSSNSAEEKIIMPHHMVKNKTNNVDNSNRANILCRAVISLKGAKTISNTMNTNNTSKASCD